MKITIAHSLIRLLNIHPPRWRWLTDWPSARLLRREKPLSQNCDAMQPLLGGRANTQTRSPSRKPGQLLFTKVNVKMQKSLSTEPGPQNVDTLSSVQLDGRGQTFCANLLQIYLFTMFCITVTSPVATDPSRTGA